MSFKKFIFTYGPGSVGSTARALTRSYIAMKKLFNASHREALIMMIENRYPKGKAIIGPETLPKSKEEIVNECHEDLKEIILYILIVENKGVRAVINNGHRYFLEVLDVINEIIEKEIKKL